jgi:hypothetical protein
MKFWIWAFIAVVVAASSGSAWANTQEERHAIEEVGFANAKLCIKSNIRDAMGDRKKESDFVFSRCFPTFLTTLSSIGNDPEAIEAKFNVLWHQVDCDRGQVC